MLHRTLKRLIEMGRTDGLKEKIGILYATGSLSQEEYEELICMIPDKGLEAEKA